MSDVIYDKVLKRKWLSEEGRSEFVSIEVEGSEFGVELQVEIYDGSDKVSFYNVEDIDATEVNNEIDEMEAKFSVIIESLVLAIFEARKMRESIIESKNADSVGD